MGINKNFVVKNGLEVADDLIFADGTTEKVGIGTTSPEYSLDVRGDVALSGELYVPTVNSNLGTFTGTLSAAFPIFVVGINTALYQVNDILDDGAFIGLLPNNTRVVNIGITSVQISRPHGQLVGSATTSFNIIRRVTPGENGQVLVSRGKDQSPIWDDSEPKVEETNSSQVHYPTFVDGTGRKPLKITSDELSFIPSSGRFGLGTTNPQAKLDVDGDVKVSEELDVTGATTLGSTLDVDGYVNLGEDLNVVGVTTLGSTLDVSGAVDFSSTLDVSGAVDFSSTLDVDGETTLGSTLDVDGDVNLGEDLNVVGITTLGSTLDVVGAVDFDSTLNVDGAVDFNSTLKVDGDVNLGEDLNVVGITTLRSTLDVIGDVEFDSKLDVSGAVDFDSTLNVDGKTTLGSTLDVDGDVNLGEDLNVVGITTLRSTLDVIGAVDFFSTLDVSGDVEFGSDLDVDGDTTSVRYFGDGVNLVGIVTNLIPGIGIDLLPNQTPGNKGEVKIESYKPVGKTIYVSQTGNDNNTGLAENHPKRTIKAAATAAIFGDTIKVFPGVYVEENPIVLKKTVSVEGTELRNCVVTPKYPYLDLFHVNNGCHITDLSYIGPAMTDGAAVVALQPLLGTSVDRFFDAARLIRTNLDYIANETVGFLTSGFSGFAGDHKEQDAARLIDLNLDYIAAETVGFLTTASPTGYGFTLSSGDYTNCKEDVASVFSAVSYDLKANSNKKSVGAALSYFNSSGGLIHITGISTQQATIAAFDYAVGIAKSVINNVTPPISYQSGIGSISQVIDPSVIQVAGGCVGVGTTIAQLVGIVTTAIGAGNTSGLPAIRFGVTLESQDCADDIKDIWKCVIHDITRGGNSRCIDAGKAYYDNEWNLIPQILKNPGEVDQTVASVDYSLNVARAVVNNSTWGGYPVGLATNVTGAVYGNVSGIATITATNHGLSTNDAVKIVGLEFSCPSGPQTILYPSGAFGYIFNVLKKVNNNSFEVVVGQSTLPHTYVTGGTVQKYESFAHDTYQVKDLAIQKDPLTGFNNAINGCSNVISAMHSCVGVVTSIVGLGSEAFSTIGIKTTYPGNSGIGFTSTIGITSAIYNEETGRTTILAPGVNVLEGEHIELRDLEFSCNSGGGISTQRFPSGKYGYDFFIDKVNIDGSFDVYVGPSTLPHTYEGSGIIVDRTVAVTTAVYNNTTGITTIRAESLEIETGDLVKIRGLQFSCPSGSGTTTIYPTGNNGFEFRVLDIVVDKPFGITTAVYNNTTGITTITAPGIGVSFNDLVELRNLEFSCTSGAATTTLYPTGNNGYKFRVLSSIGSTFTVNVGPSTIAHTYVSGGVAIDRTLTSNDEFTINVGVSTIPHNYVSGGIVIPPFSRGVGPITQGPYVRNCTNFIPNSIGMKVDGFDAEPGDKDDIGVTGTMSVDSYTQYNQGGIGVSITNGAYSQLVSIFTICDDIAIFTGSGGQCDITNSNSSFGNLGLVSDGVGDINTKSIYRYTGIANTALSEQNIIEVSGIGALRPYDGQALYFGELFYEVRGVTIVNGGSGYTQPPRVTIDFPTGPNGIRAEATSAIDSSGRVSSIDIISNGSQYKISDRPTITIDPPTNSGTTATAKLEFYPLYYTIASATLPSSGISTITLNTNLNNNVSLGTTVYFNRISLQIVSSHSFEWVGSGNDINKAKPALGGVVKTENEVVKLNGGEVFYTSTDQAGNFKIGDDLTINQLTGTVTGRAFNQSILNNVTPLIIALGR
jgi:cytoskeletal protein CcmA (bactofilin family)